MDIILIQATVVTNVIQCTSLAIAQASHPEAVCVVRTAAKANVGPGHTTLDGGNTFFPPGAQPRPSRLATQDFIQRFTDAEYIAILTAEKANMTVAAWINRLQITTPDDDGTSVDLLEPRTLTDLQSFEVLGLLAAGRAAQIAAV